MVDAAFDALSKVLGPRVEDPATDAVGAVERRRQAEHGKVDGTRLVQTDEQLLQLLRVLRDVRNGGWLQRTPNES